MKNSQKLLFYQIGNLISFFAVVIVNALANILPLNGKNTGTLSDNIPNLFVPAGLTFAVWGVIYFLLAIFAFYQARPKTKIESEILTRIGPWFIIGSIANFVWIFLWHWELIDLSLIAMLILLVSLLISYIRLQIGLSGENKASKADKIAVHLTHSVYLGWITVATIANVTAVAVVNSWGGWGIAPEIWTILVLIVATLITSILIWLRKDYAYSGVVIWAFIGIILKRIDPSFPPQIGIVATAIIGIMVLTVLITVKIILSRKK